MDVYNLHTMQKEESVSSPLSVALGCFDGVHSGHAELLRRTAAIAAASGTASAVWTFSDSGGMLPNKPGARFITTMEEKLKLFAGFGIDYALLFEFAAVRDYTPERFVRELLIDKCRVVSAVCGYNFRFGAGGLGTSDMLRELMKPHECTVIQPILICGKPVSSSLIRGLLESGDMEGAAVYLGRPFSVTLPVVHGNAIGRKMGIPTMNQSFPQGHVIPKKGIYASSVDIGGKIYPCVSNVGTKPTVSEGSDTVNCETHIIGYRGWLYGSNISVRFHTRLRDEMKFESIDALRAQIDMDINAALTYFSENSVI